ncbi:MAG TPA: hypothetical protein ENH82_14170 [bacterium]|nr:hypothetical protein [bacterium]
MTENVHYGLIPGCGDKPALLKAGAEKIAMAFHIAPRFHVTVDDLGNGHREYYTQTELFSIITKNFIGEGVGSCSTMETKWRYRNQSQKCPVCGAEAIIKGKEQYGGGWVCFKKKGGCGAKFVITDPAIADQAVGKIEHEDPADYYNTCRKMSKKRSLIDAILTATAASDIFTQDIDETPELFGGKEPERNLRKEIGVMLMEMCDGDVDEASHRLKEYSSKTKCEDITEDQLHTVYGKIKKDFEKAAEVEPKEEIPPAQADVGDGDNIPA